MKQQYFRVTMLIVASIGLPLLGILLYTRLTSPPGLIEIVLPAGFSGLVQIQESDQAKADALMYCDTHRTYHVKLTVPITGTLEVATLRFLGEPHEKRVRLGEGRPLPLWDVYSQPPGRPDIVGAWIAHRSSPRTLYLFIGNYTVEHEFDRLLNETESRSPVIPDR